MFPYLYCSSVNDTAHSYTNCNNLQGKKAQLKYDKHIHNQRCTPNLDCRLCTNSHRLWMNSMPVSEGCFAISQYRLMLKKARASGQNVGKVFNPVLKLVFETTLSHTWASWEALTSFVHAVSITLCTYVSSYWDKLYILSMMVILAIMYELHKARMTTTFHYIQCHLGSRKDMQH